MTSVRVSRPKASMSRSGCLAAWGTSCVRTCTYAHVANHLDDSAPRQSSLHSLRNRHHGKPVTIDARISPDLQFFFNIHVRSLIKALDDNGLA